MKTQFLPEQHTSEQAGGAMAALQKNAFTLSGIGGVVGYSALMLDGIMRGDNTLALTGIAALSPVILTIFGEGDKSASVARMTSQMRDYMNAEGYEIPAEGFKKDDAKGVGALYQLLKEHPVECSYATMFLGTSFLLAAGVKEYKDKGEVTKLATAFTTMLGSALVASVPPANPLEKEEDQPQNAASKAYRVLQNHTTQAFGLLNLVDIWAWTTETLNDSFKESLPLLGNVYKHGRDQKLAGFENEIEHLTKTIGQHNDILGSVQTGQSGSLAEELREAAQKAYGSVDLKDITPSKVLENLANLTQMKETAAEGLKYLSPENKLGIGNMSKGEASGILKAIVMVGLSTQILLNFAAHKDKTAEEMLAQYEKGFEKTAEMLQHIPKQDRELALQQMVSFMSVNDTMKDACMTPSEIKASIEKQLEQLEKKTPQPAVAANNVVSAVESKGRMAENQPAPSVKV